MERVGASRFSSEHLLRGDSGRIGICDRRVRAICLDTPRIPTSGIIQGLAALTPPRLLCSVLCHPCGEKKAVGRCLAVNIAALSGRFAQVKLGVTDHPQGCYRLDTLRIKMRYRGLVRGLRYSHTGRLNESHDHEVAVNKGNTSKAVTEKWRGEVAAVYRKRRRRLGLTSTEPFLGDRIALPNIWSGPGAEALGTRRPMSCVFPSRRMGRKSLI